jgi:TonB family protein
MKLNLFLFTLALYCNASGQTKETYYDFFWKESTPENATYYSIKKKTDSGWLQTDYYIRTKKQQMSALFSDEESKIQNGHAHYFHANGLPSIIGTMIDNKQEGVCISYHSNGMMSDSAFFRNGKVVDKRLKWHFNGMISDSIARINDSTYVHIGWFEDGNISYAGYMVNDKHHGKWQYFHHNGQPSAWIMQSNGIVLKAEYFEEGGKPLKDTSMVNRPASFPGGQAAWTKYLQKNLHWPKGLAFSTSASVTVGVRFWVDEDGQVTDAEIYNPFHEAFDKIALRIIKNSPKWSPAILHNRKVRVEKRQPISFSQPE